MCGVGGKDFMKFDRNQIKQFIPPQEHYGGACVSGRGTDVSHSGIYINLENCFK